MEQKRISHPCYRFPQVDISCSWLQSTSCCCRHNIQITSWHPHLSYPLSQILHPGEKHFITSRVMLHLKTNKTFKRELSVAQSPLKKVWFPISLKIPCDLFVVGNYLWFPNFLVTNFLCLRLYLHPIPLCFSLFVCFREQWVELWGNYFVRNLELKYCCRTSAVWGGAGQERPKAKMTSKIEECCAGCWGVIWEYFISAIQQYHKGIPYFISFLLLEFKSYTPTYGYYQKWLFFNGQLTCNMSYVLCINSRYQRLVGSQRAVEKNLFLK